LDSPLIPAFSPSGGEGDRRAVEGDAVDQRVSPDFQLKDAAWAESEHQRSGRKRLQPLHHRRRRLHRVRDVRFRMRGGNEARLELRRGEIDARSQHAVEELLEALAVGLHRVGKIPNRFAREVAAEHRAAAVEGDGDVRGLGGLAQAGFELRAFRFQLGVGGGMRSAECGVRSGRGGRRCASGFRIPHSAFRIGKFFQRRDARGHRERVAAQGAGLIHGAERREAVHDVAPPAERTDGQAAADDFAERREVGPDAEALLRAAGREAEAGHHLVEDQHRLLLCRDLPEQFQVARSWQIQARVARHRLDDDRRDFAPVRGEARFQCLHVVVGQHERVLGEVRRHARAVGVAEGQRAGAGLHQQAVRVAVVAAVELDELVALREAAREADGAHARLGAGVAHPHFVHAGHERLDEPRHRDLERVRDAETRAVVGGGLHGGDDLRMRVPEDGRPPGADVVNQLVAVHRGHPRALGGLHEERLSAHGAEGAHGRVHPAGNVLQRLGKQRLGLGPRNHGWMIARRRG
jgi:hypothetical protein